MLINYIFKLISNNSAVIIENPINIRYLTGFNLDNGFLIITKSDISDDGCKKEQIFFFVDDRFLLDVTKTINKKDSPEKIEVVRLTNFQTQIKNTFKLLNINKVYLETDYVTLKRHKYYLGIFSDIGAKTYFNADLINNIAKIRSQKLGSEITKIKEAQRLVDEAFSYIVETITVGLTEKQICAELRKKVIDLGCEDFAFDYIVVSGENTAIPHGKPSDRKIQKGDAVTLDFGAKIDGYCSDMTRTIFVGNISEEKKEVYQTVLNAQNKAINSIEVGVKASQIDKIVRNYLAEKGYEKFFTHSLGHGVGLQVHEKPNLSSQSQDIILDRQVITVEPGIYIPERFGIRIEDMIFVNGTSIENLTKSSKDLISV